MFVRSAAFRPADPFMHPVLQKNQAFLPFMPVTILQTLNPSNPFKINTYKTTSQLLILNHLLGHLNPLDATLTQKSGEGASFLRHLLASPNQRNASNFGVSSLG